MQRRLSPIEAFDETAWGIPVDEGETAVRRRSQKDQQAMQALSLSMKSWTHPAMQPVKVPIVGLEIQGPYRLQRFTAMEITHIQ